MELVKMIQDGVTIFLGIMVEGIPFLLFGVLVSVFLGLFVKEESFLKFLPKSSRLQSLFLALAGVFFPVCECGNVPVARKLSRLKVKAEAIIAFLIAAPVLNPVVFASTYVAFKGNLEILIARFVGTFLISMFTAFIFSRIPREILFLDNFEEERKCNRIEGDCVLDDHFHRGTVKGLSKKFKVFCFEVNKEMLEMVNILAKGALFAALIQIFVPRSFFVEFGLNPIVSVLMMMGLAMVMSVCSSVDAFVALSYLGSVSTGGIVAFLVFGPVIDLKSIVMFRSVFKPGALKFLVIVVVLQNLIFGLLLNYWFG